MGMGMGMHACPNDACMLRPHVPAADAVANGYVARMKHTRDLGNRVVEAPVFKLGGLAVGNGFTDAETQTAVQAEVAYNMGLIDMAQRRKAEAIQAQIIDLVRSYCVY